MLPLSQRLLSALIVKEDSGEVSRSFYDGQQDDCILYPDKDSPCGNCTQMGSETENAGKLELEIQPDMEMKNWKHHILDYCNYDSHFTNEHQNDMAENICSDDFRQDDIVVHSEVLGFNAEFRGLDEKHRHGVKKKQNDLQSNCQTFGLISSNAASDMQSQDMDLDQ
ncbi:hypothetical protein SUGI_1193680 [Cryptomeria japonica]|nr:hypothetical protein SUGI_1193680 [Cryptomeria japonica]